MKKRIISLITALALIIPTAVVFAEDSVNVILNCEAKASSYEGDEHLADKANDGINDNADYTYWQSAEDDSLPYWQGDMGLSFAISKIELEARKENENSEERKNLRILGANKEDFSDAVVLAEAEDDFGETLTAEFADRVRVRYIRVEKTAEGALSIGEIKVYSEKDEILQGAESNNPDYVIKDILTSYDGELTDIWGTKYENYINILCAMGIINGYPDGTFRPQQDITRAEFMKIAAKLMGYIPAATEVSFLDVPATHWAYAYIQGAKEQGIVDGTSKTTFSPEAKISANEVIKILVCILGYKQMAELSGGYPGGYLNYATSLEILDNVDLSSGAINRGEVMIMVANALEAEVLLTSGTGDTYTNGETLLTKKLKMNVGEGIVTAVTGTSLTRGNEFSDKNAIKIDGELYTSEIVGKDKYLGMKVKFYYEIKDDESYEIIAIIADEDNEILEIEASDIRSADFSSVTYYDTNKSKTATLSSEMDVIYNGFALRDYQRADLIPADGDIVLIDNDDDKDFDVYFVNNTVSYVVSRVNAEDNLISSKNGAGMISFDEDRDFVSIKNADGMEVNIEEIAEDWVLTVSESKQIDGAKYYTVMVSDKAVTGTLESMDDDYVSVGGESYKMTSAFNKSDALSGEYGVFYIDYKGRAVFYDKNAVNNEEYGILTKVLTDDNIENSITFRIFTSVGSFENIATDWEKLKIDGDHKEGAVTIKSYLSAKALDGGVAQLVKYKKNAKGEIVAVDTLARGSREDDTSLTEDFSSALRYYKSSGVFGAAFAVGADTVMISLPDNFDDEDDYDILTTASLSSDTRYNVAAYDGGEEQVMKCILFTGGSSGDGTSSSRLMLVDEYETAVNAEGDVVTRVSGLYDGRMQTFEAYDNSVALSTLSQGDVITLTLTSGNKIKSFRKMFYEGAKPEGAVSSAISTLEPQNGDVDGELYLAYGKAMSLKDGRMILKPSTSIPYEQIMVSVNSGDLDVYVYDSAEEEIRLSDYRSIMDAKTAGEAGASNVLVRMRFRTEYELIVFK